MSTKKEKTREHILDVSYVLFAKHGFKSITMKDICEETGLSRGGLYNHFSSTREVFEAILQKINQKDEMHHPEDSLSLAMYEYAGAVGNGLMDGFTKSGEEKWKALIEYGISTGEFHKVDTMEIVTMILYAYQGIRAWSRIITMSGDTIHAIISHIRKQLIKEMDSNGV